MHDDPPVPSIVTLPSVHNISSNSSKFFSAISNAFFLLDFFILGGGGNSSIICDQIEVVTTTTTTISVLQAAPKATRFGTKNTANKLDNNLNLFFFAAVFFQLRNCSGLREEEARRNF